MNKVVPHIFVLILVLFAKAVFSQDAGIVANNVDNSSNSLNGKILGKRYILSPLENSNFLYPSDWAEGTIQMQNGDRFSGLRIKFHAFEDEVIAYNENNSLLFKVEKQLVASFTFKEEGKERKFLKQQLKNKNQYFELLYSGNNRLLARRYIHEKHVRPYVDNLGIMRDIEYVLWTDFYLFNTKDELHKLPLSIRGYINLMPEQKKQIRRLLRKNRILINSETEMIKAFNLIDQAGLFN